MPLGAAAAAVGGQILGAKLSHYANADLQSRQFAEQEKLQQRAVEANAAAVRNQAPLQVTGMQQAGLNPASVAGTGAPVVSPGAAAGASTQLGSVFDGLSQLVQAIKQPSETEKVYAETGLVQANTERAEAETAKVYQEVKVVTPKVLSKMDQEIDKLRQDVRSAKNANDMFDSQRKFLGEHSKAVFSGFIQKLQDQGTYDSLSSDTKDTLAKLANGELVVDQGSFDALMKTIEAQSKLSDADRKLVENAFANNLTVRQFMDDDVMNALTKFPADTRKELYTRIDKMNKEIEGIAQDIKTSKTQAALNKALERLHDFNREASELNDVKWLAKQGRFDDVDTRTWEQSLNNVQEMFQGVTRAMEMMIMSRMAGQAAGQAAAPQQSSGPKIQPPSDADVRRYNAPRTFNQTNEYGGDGRTIYRDFGNYRQPGGRDAPSY